MEHPAQSQHDFDHNDPFKIAGAVRSFLEHFSAPPGLDLSRFTTIDPVAFATVSKSQKPESLGDFDRLLEFCGKPVPRRPSPAADSSSASNDEPITPVSSAPEDTIRNKGKRADRENGEERALVQTVGGSSSNTDGFVFSDHDEYVRNILDTDGLVFGDGVFGSVSSRRPIRVLDKGKGGPGFSSEPPVLSPASAVLRENRRPGTLPSPFVDPIFLKGPAGLSFVQAHYTLTCEEQKTKLIKKLISRFPQDAGSLRSLEISMPAIGKLDKSGIHVFVDLSNIVIGFCERIKENRRRTGQFGQGARIKQPPFSFESLALVLERGRDFTYKAMAGSTSHDTPKKMAIPSHVREGEKLGYQPNILERVLKPQTFSAQKKKGGRGSGYLTTGYSSASDAQTNLVMKMQEQGVDEVLQLKMAMSLLIHKEPSTMVLASGDAAEAEYSGGFLKMVELALSRGWKVEVVAWRDGLSAEYRSAGLLRKWGDKLTIIELDDFAEEMLALYSDK